MSLYIFSIIWKSIQVKIQMKYVKKKKKCKFVFFLNKMNSFLMHLHDGFMYFHWTKNDSKEDTLKALVNYLESFWKHFKSKISELHSHRSVFWFMIDSHVGGFVLHG